MAAPVPSLEDYYSKKVYERRLTANDIKERSRLYIKKSPARKICPAAFGPHVETKYTRALPFCDAHDNPLPMVFRRRGSKRYLIGGWGRFVQANNLSPGDIIKIHKLTPKSGVGEAKFMIGRVEVAGVLIG